MMNKKEFNVDYAWIDSFWNKIEKKLDVIAPQVEAVFADGIKDGKYVNCSKYWWTNGFWPGMMWLMYLKTGDDKFKNIAIKVEEALDEAIIGFDGLHHDVGFMWLPSAVANYRITGNEKSRTRGMHVATVLAGRFNIAGNYIRAWEPDSKQTFAGWAIIDSMMNIPLLHWASEVSTDPRFSFIANAHADMAMERFVRPDGSTKHVVISDPATGEYIGESPTGGQGYAPGSCWSRGNSWALYGFALQYIHTGEEKYLDMAKRVAHYFMANIDDSGVPKCDFRQPAEPLIVDTTAGAVAACGLIEISKVVPEGEKEMYLAGAVKLLKGLEANCDFSLDNQSILQNGTGAYRDAGSHHIAIVYGDYYMMEALLKLKGNDVLFW